MARKKGKPVTYHQRIVNFLADGKWRTLKEIHNHVARFISAELSDKEYRRRHPKWEEVKELDRVRQGRKRLVLLSLLTLVHHRKLVEIGEGRDWQRQYRMTEEAVRARAETGGEA
jgi:hypothetical protein